MILTQTNTPIRDDRLKSINFFNGRLLSAEDLSQEQKANKEAHHYLGQAAGDGIAFGLEVKVSTGRSTKQAPVISVSAGLAVNRLGQTLQLSSAVEVALVRPVQNGSTTTVNALFADCQPLQNGPYVVGKGVYLLTLRPASEKDGKAPVSGLGNIDAACNARYQIDAVQFRLIQLPIQAAELNDAAHLRNILAHRCFGSSDARVTAFGANPFGPPVTQYGLLDDLRPDCLKDEEVPLAVIFWTVTNGIEFVDMWSVRRRLTRNAADSDWALLTSDRRMAEGEAMFLQFQEQIEDMRISGVALKQVGARDAFINLPPAGLLPIGTGASANGFEYATFFSQMTYRKPIFIEGAQLRPLLQEAFTYSPIETSGQIVVWLYIVRENAQAVLSGSKPPQSYLVFASGHTPYRGEARYDVHRWNFGNFA